MTYSDLRGFPATVHGWKVRAAKQAGWRMPWYWFPIMSSGTVNGRRMAWDVVHTPRSRDWWAIRAREAWGRLVLEYQTLRRYRSPHVIMHRACRGTPPKHHTLEQRIHWFRSQLWHAAHD